MADNQDQQGTDKPEELVPVGPGADEFGGEVVVPQGQDDHPADGDDDGDEGDDDDRVSHAEGDDDDGDGSDPDREAIRARRRTEKQRRKEKQQRDKRELNFLRMRNEQLERRFSQVESRTANTEILAVDQRINSLNENIRQAEEIYAQSISAGKGEDAAEAQRIRDELRDELRKTESIKQNIIQGERQRREAPVVPPEIQSQAQNWMARNEWFDPQLGDDDSAIARTVEIRLANENRFNPGSPEYWDELDRRLARVLPHRFSDDGDERPVNGGQQRQARQQPQQQRQPNGPRLTTGGRERPIGKNEVFVSKERIDAMREAGVWDDPVLRQKYLRRYKEWDEQNGVRQH